MSSSLNSDEESVTNMTNTSTSILVRTHARMYWTDGLLANGKLIHSKVKELRGCCFEFQCCQLFQPHQMSSAEDPQDYINRMAYFLEQARTCVYLRFKEFVGFIFVVGYSKLL